jgi:hypothetical protein
MPFSRKSIKTSITLLLLLVASVPLFFFGRYMIAKAAGTVTHHYLYVVPDGGLSIYDIDNGFALVKHVSLPVSGGRGLAVDPLSGSLFVSYYGSSNATAPGWLLKYNLLNDTIVWNKQLPFSVDSPAITPDGKQLYMPESQGAYSGIWHILSTTDASSLGTISIGGGDATHNTVISLNGSHAYLGALSYNYLVQADTTTHQITKRIGPLKAGVRPFTINGKETLAFTTATGFLGFEVSDINTGKVLYTVPVKGFTSSSPVPAHGVSLSPDEKEIYLMDDGNSYAHVFDVSGLPATAPQQVADIPLRSMAGQEASCNVDCQKEGWMLHSLDGHYVFAGDSGDVIDTTTRKSIANVPDLYNSRKYIEVDFSNGVTVATSTRHGIGRVTGNSVPTPTPTPTTTAGTPTLPTPTPTATPLGTPPVSTQVQDTFQRANQSYWGTASNGQKWSGDANTNTIFSISGNTGKIAGNGTAYNAILGPSTNDGEVVFSGALSSYTNGNFGAVLRWTDTNDWYKAYISGTQLVIQSRVKGTSTVLSSANFTATAGTSYTIRFRVVANNLYAKVWPSNSTEPANWLATTTSTALTSGFPGLRIQAASGATATISSYQATNPGSQVTPTPTPIATSTPSATPTVTSTPTTTPTPIITPTPTPPAGIVGQDSFTRAKQSFWGTATSGQSWGGDANNNSAFSITNNTGAITGNGTTPLNAILGSSTTDSEVLISGSISSFNTTNFGAVLRWTDTNNWYKAYLNGTQLVIQKKVNGTATTLSSTAFTATAGTSYSIRFRIVGSTLSAKAWKTGATEPTAWTVTTTDTTFTSGFDGLRVQLQSGINAIFTSFQETSLSGA